MINPLANRNPRERRLIAVTGAVLLVAALFLVARTAIATMGELNRQIGDREVEIESLKQQNLQAESVNAAYDKAVKQNSSAMTVAEIHDALRREIFNLAQVEFPATGDKPARTMQLVRIPALQEGQLTEGEGHREYQIRFQIPSATLVYLLAFLERVEDSEQLLHIDSLDLACPPESDVQALMQITRIVLDNPEAIATGNRTAAAGDSQ